MIGAYSIGSQPIGGESQAAADIEPRYARPQSDVSAGAWLPSTGSDLFAMIDEAEAEADATDYIYTDTPSTCEIALNAVQDPLSSAGQKVRYQVWSDTGSGLTVTLKQGAAVIATWTHASLPVTPTVFSQTLNALEAGSITDFGDLRLTFEALA